MFLFISMILMAWSAHATLTIDSITGVSNWTDATVDSAGVAVKPAIAGGYIGNASCVSGGSQDGTNVCNTCAGNLKPCNVASVYPSLKIYVQLTSSASLTASSTAFVTNSTDSKSISPINTPVISGNTVTFIILWSELCSSYTTASDCTTGFLSKTLTLGVDPAGGTSATDSIVFNLNFSYLDANDATVVSYTDCPTGAEYQYGICHIKMEKGDEKVYADELTQGSGYPNSLNSNPNFSSVIFFYEQAKSGEDNATTFGRVTNSSAHTEFTANTSATPATFSDNRITGLTNDVNYCFVMANKDITGNIYLFTPSTATVADYCATPTKVIGLLDDKHCFIATAAFGSQMAPEVDTFRHFRNRFLLNHSWGRSFVRTYYKYSPPFANFISQSETLRAVARGALWPLLVFAKLSLRWGAQTCLLILGLALLGLCGVFASVKIRRTKRGQA